MSSNPRYTPLHNEDVDDTDAAPVTTTITTTTEETNNVESPALPPASGVGDVEDNPGPPNQSPPPYTVSGGEPSHDHVEFSNEPPPLYTDVVKLPTYNESENLVDDDEDDEENEEHETSHGQRSIFFNWLHHDTVHSDGERDSPIGSDAWFMFSFMLALLFNWIGFLISYCFTNNLASYYGAIAGFGISLVKWTFIAQSSEWSKEFMMENPWFCYAFGLFGMVMFMRGIFAYIQLKRLTNQNYLLYG